MKIVVITGGPHKEGASAMMAEQYIIRRWQSSRPLIRKAGCLAEGLR